MPPCIEQFLTSSRDQGWSDFHTVDKFDEMNLECQSAAVANGFAVPRNDTD